MKVLLTGATGYIGSRVAKRLITHGHSVIGLVRSSEAKQLLERQGMDTVMGNLAQPESFLAAVHQADGVIHTAFNHTGDFFEEVKIEKRAISAILDALSGLGKPFIATNGTGILGDTGLTPADETFSVAPEFPASVRAEFENLMQESATNGVRTVVLRLPILLYGYGQSVLLPALVDIAKRTGIAYYIGDGQNRLSSAHVDDVAELYVLALEKATPGSIFNVSVGEAVSGQELADAIRHAVGRDCHTESISFEQASKILNPFFALLVSLNNQVSAQQAIAQLGWKPKGSPTLLDDLKYGSYRQIEMLGDLR